MKLFKKLTSLLLAALLTVSVFSWLPAASAAGLDPYAAEDAVTIYMNNVAVWKHTEMYSMGRYITFIDINLDGINEMVYMESMGTAISTRLVFYGIDTQTQTVKKLTDTFYGADAEWGYPEGYKVLLYNNNTKSVVYLGEDKSGDGINRYNYQYYQMYMTEKGIVNLPMSYSATGMTSGYKTNWNKLISELNGDYVNLNMKSQTIDYNSFRDYGASVQKAILLECYKAFQYDSLIFQKNSYIADLWLGLKGKKDSIESKTVSSILALKSVSSEMFLEMDSDQKFRFAVLTWEAAKAAFDLNDEVKRVLSEDLLYESLIFDMIRGIIDQNENAAGITMQDACDFAAEKTGFVTKAANRIKQAAEIAGGAETMAQLLKWKDASSGWAERFVNKLTSSKDPLGGIAAKRLNVFSEGISRIVTVSQSVSEFYARLANYMMLFEVDEEIDSFLAAMLKEAKDGAFKKALITVRAAFSNVDLAAYICDATLARNVVVDLGIGFAETALKACPEYYIIKTIVNGTRALVDLVLNTNSTVQAYYMLKATNNFFDAGNAAVRSLGQTYQISGNEKDAAAYVFAVRAYRCIYEVDLESALSYIRAARQEGVLNGAKKLIRNLSDMLNKTETKDSYDEALLCKTNIMKSIDMQFDSLMNTWRFDPSNLKTDYPSVYHVFAAEAYKNDLYTPHLEAAKLNKDGSVTLRWLGNLTYKDSNGATHVLYGMSDLEKVEITETVGADTVTKTAANNAGENSFVFENAAVRTAFPRTYAARAYEETADGNLYTNASFVTVDSPCGIVRLLPIAEEDGVKIMILDTAPYQEGVKYRIFRSGNDGVFSEVGSISRKMEMIDTLYFDRTAEAGKQYSYKIVSEFTFANGETICSEESEVMTAIREVKTIFGTIFVNDARVQPLTDPTVNKARSKAGAETDGCITLSWDAVENADGYRIFRRASYASSYSLLADCKNTQFTDETALAAFGYSYYVLPYYADENAGMVYDFRGCGTGNVQALIESGKLGDPSGDGEITAEDARLALRCAVGLESFAAGTREFLACDVTCDGKVTAEDARSILRAAVGLEDPASWSVQ